MRFQTSGRSPFHQSIFGPWLKLGTLPVRRRTSPPRAGLHRGDIVRATRIEPGIVGRHRPAVGAQAYDSRHLAVYRDSRHARAFDTGLLEAGAEGPEDRGVLPFRILLDRARGGPGEEGRLRGLCEGAALERVQCGPRPLSPYIHAREAITLHGSLRQSITKPDLRPSPRRAAPMASAARSRGHLPVITPLASMSRRPTRSRHFRYWARVWREVPVTVICL